MTKLSESVLTSILLFVFVLVSGVMVYSMPFLLNIAYNANNCTFDLSLCENLLHLYGLVLMCIPFTVGVSLVKDGLIYFKMYEVRR